MDNTVKREANRNCTRCGLHLERTQVVLPDTDVHNANTLVAIGEGPGRDEDRVGYGFAGRAGKTLDQVFGEFGVARTEYARINMAMCRPPENRKPKKDELAACEHWVVWWLTEQLPTEVILAVGGTPALYFYDAKSLSEAISLGEQRNYVPTLPWAAEAGIKVVPCPHTSPLAWNRFSPEGTRWRDIGRRQVETAVQLSRTGT